MASIAPVTDRIKSLVFLGGAGGCGLGGGGLEGAALAFFDCWAGCCTVAGDGGGAVWPKNSSDEWEESGASNRFDSSPLVTNMFFASVENILAVVASVVVAASKPVLGALASVANEAKGFVESTVMFADW